MYEFYRREEIKNARHEKRTPEISFTLTCHHIGIKWYIRHLLLDEDYIIKEIS